MPGTPFSNCMLNVFLVGCAIWFFGSASVVAYTALA